MFWFKMNEGSCFGLMNVLVNDSWRFWFKMDGGSG